MVDATQIVNRVALTLASESPPADVSLIWWTVEELYSILNQSMSRLARESALMVTRTELDSATVLALSARHVAMLDVSHGSQSLQVATIRELEARRGDWRSIMDWLVLYFVLDADGEGKVRLWPGPLDAEKVTLIERVGPAPASSAAPDINVPHIVGDVLEWCVIAEARGREGLAQMPEVGKVAGDVLAVLESALKGVYGESQTPG